MKNIIKRIIVGVGIALLLMLIKDKALIMQVSAKTCTQTRISQIHPFSGAKQWNKTLTQNSNPADSTIGFRFDGTSSYAMSFDEDADFMEVWIPIVYSINLQSSNTGNEFSGAVSVPICRIRDNTMDVNNTVAYYMYYEDGYYKYRYDKRAYPNKTSVNLRGIDFIPPAFLYNFSTSNLWVWVPDYWQLHFYSCESNQDIENAIEQNTQATQQVDETLNDDSVDNDKASNDINSMNSKVATNGSITSLLTLPISLYQAILNSASGSCSSFSLGSLFNHNLTLPCINLENLLGSTLFGIIDMLCSGLFILSFRKKMVDIFNHMTSLNDRGNELE